MIKIPQIDSLLSKINEKNQYYILGGILVLILLFDYFVVMQWQLRTLRTLNPEITTLGADLKNAKNNMQRVEQFKADVVRLKSEVQQSAKSIISKEEFPLLLENISRMAKDSGVQIDQIKPDASLGAPVLENKEGTYYSFPILVNARGGYHEIGRFFNKIESDTVFLNITEFQLVANLEDVTRHMARLTVEALIFEGK